MWLSQASSASSWEWPLPRNGKLCQGQQSNLLEVTLACILKLFHFLAGPLSPRLKSRCGVLALWSLSWHEWAAQNLLSNSLVLNTHQASFQDLWVCPRQWMRVGTWNTWWGNGVATLYIHHVTVLSLFSLAWTFTFIQTVPNCWCTRTLLTKLVWFPGQQYQHHLGTC